MASLMKVGLNYKQENIIVTIILLSPQFSLFLRDSFPRLFYLSFTLWFYFFKWWFSIANYTVDFNLCIRFRFQLEILPACDQTESQKTKNMAPGPITSWEIDGETVETVSDFILGGSKSLQMVIAAMKLKDAYSLEGKLWPT